MNLDRRGREVKGAEESFTEEASGWRRLKVNIKKPILYPSKDNQIENF